MSPHQRQIPRPYLSRLSTSGHSHHQLENWTERPADRGGEIYSGHGHGIGFPGGGDRQHSGSDEHSSWYTTTSLRNYHQPPPGRQYPVSSNTETSPYGYGTNFWVEQPVPRTRPRSQTAPSQPGTSTRQRHHPYHIRLRDVNENGIIGYGQGHNIILQTTSPQPPTMRSFDDLEVPPSATSSEMGFDQLFEQPDIGIDGLFSMSAFSTVPEFGLDPSELFSGPETPQSSTLTDTPSITSGQSPAGSHTGYPSCCEDYLWTPDLPNTPNTPALCPISDTVCMQTLEDSLPKGQQHVRSVMDRAQSEFGVVIQEPSGLPDLQTIRIIDASAAVSEATRTGSVAKTSVEENAIRKRTNAAKFICWRWRRDCKQTFTARHNAINHEYSHLGIRRYRCQYYSTCERAFVTKSDAKRHEEKCCGRPPDSDAPDDSQARSRSRPIRTSNTNVPCGVQGAEPDSNFSIRFF